VAWLYTDLEGDKSIYLLFARSLAAGHHPLEDLGLINGVHNYIYNGAFTSPLYSLIAAPLFWITRSPFATSIIIDIAGWLLLLTGLYKFSILILKERWIANILILCAGFFIYPHELDSAPKDQLTTGLILWLIVLCVRFLNTRPSVGLSLTIIVALICLGLVKLLSAPLVLSFIFMLLVFSILKSRSHVIHTLSIGFICLATAIGFNQYLNYLSGLQPVKNIETLPYQIEFIKGFYPYNLTATFPFISSTLINVNFWCVQLEDILKVPFLTISRFFQLLDVLLLIPVIILVKTILKKSEDKKAWIFGIAICLSLLFMVTYMSISYKAIEYYTGSRWTYVRESRSFFFIILFLEVALFYLIFRSGVSGMLKNFLLILFFIECLHGGYFTIKQLRLNNDIPASETKSAVKKITGFLVYSRDNLKSPVSLSTSHPQLRQYAQLNGIEVISYRKAPCDIFQSQPDFPLVIVQFEKDSSTLQDCHQNQRLITTDTIPPFIVKLYTQ
jgi:hypothetical protein